MQQQLKLHLQIEQIDNHVAVQQQKKRSHISNQPQSRTFSTTNYAPHHQGHVVLSPIRPKIPAMYKIFGQSQFFNDKIAFEIQPFLNNPSLAGLFLLVQNEVLRWKHFVKMFTSQERKLLHLQVAQISAARFPAEFDELFVVHSLICRLFYCVQIRQPAHRSHSPQFSVAVYFATLRNLPDFIRNLANEIVTRCNIATIDWMVSFKNSLSVRNTSNTTYDSAVRQLSNEFGFDLTTFKVMLVDPNSDIPDDLLMNIILNKVLQERWGVPRATTAICGLKNIGSANNCPRFEHKLWNTFEKACKLSGKNKKLAPMLVKSLKPQFALRIYYAAKKHGPIRHQECLRLMFLTWQRKKDYINFRARDIFWFLTFVDLSWLWSKTRSRHEIVQNTKCAFGQSGTFYDIKSCLENLILLQPASDLFLLEMKTTKGRSISHGALLRLYAAKVPVIFHTLPMKDLSMHCIKYMGSFILSKTNGLHPQVASHYLRHSTKSPEFRSMILSLFPQFAAQWFSPTSLKYVLHVDHLASVGTELQRIWDEKVQCIEQENVASVLQGTIIGPPQQTEGSTTI